MKSLRDSTLEEDSKLGEVLRVLLGVQQIKVEEILKSELQRMQEYGQWLTVVFDGLWFCVAPHSKQVAVKSTQDGISCNLMEIEDIQCNATLNGERLHIPWGSDVAGGVAAYLMVVSKPTIHVRLICKQQQALPPDASPATRREYRLMCYIMKLETMDPIVKQGTTFHARFCAVPVRKVQSGNFVHAGPFEDLDGGAFFNALFRNGALDTHPAGSDTDE